MLSEQEILTTEEVAKLLRITPGSIRNCLSKNREFIPHMKVGGVLRFVKKDVLAHFMKAPSDNK